MFNNTQKGTNVAHTILRLPSVRTVTGLSRSTIYLRISEGSFPPAIGLGGRAVGWLEDEIQQWVQRHIDASREALKDLDARAASPKVAKAPGSVKQSVARKTRDIDPAKSKTDA